MNNSIGESWHTTASVKNELLTPLCVVEMFELVLYSFKISAGCLLAAEAVAAAECMCACGHQQRQCMQRRASARRTAPPHAAICSSRRTLDQNHKKHSIALLGPFVLKKGPNRGIKCQFDILEKKQRGNPSTHLCQKIFHL